MAQLEIYTSKNGKCIYTDYCTKAHRDLAVFEPEIPDGFYMVGHYGQPDHGSFMKGTVPLVKPLHEDVIAPPIDFEKEWDDKGSGGKQDVSFWRVIPPPGYIALGDVISVGYDPPHHLKEKYACIRADLAIAAKIGHLIWNSKGSKADKDGSMWSVQPMIQGVTGYFKVKKGNSPPIATPYAYTLRCAV